MEKDNYFFKLLFVLFILGIFAYMGINGNYSAPL